MEFSTAWGTQEGTRRKQVRNPCVLGWQKIEHLVEGLTVHNATYWQDFHQLW